MPKNSKNRVILADVGNTSMSFAFYMGGRFFGRKTALHGEIPRIVKFWLKSGRNLSNYVILCSTVPQIERDIRKRLAAHRNIHYHAVGFNIYPQINHKYRYINKLGNDRITSICGALKIYRPPFLLIDYGTAVTFDYVSAARGGTFEGGMIIPGPELSFQSLIHRAAMIPSSLRLPHRAKNFLGKTTLDCLSSGVLEGYGAMTDGLINRYKLKFGRKLRVIATGGFSHHLKPYTSQIDIFDYDLLLKSLLLLHKNSRRIG